MPAFIESFRSIGVTRGGEEEAQGEASVSESLNNLGRVGGRVSRMPKTNPGARDIEVHVAVQEQNTGYDARETA